MAFFDNVNKKNYQNKVTRSYYIGIKQLIYLNCYQSHFINSFLIFIIYLFYV